MSDELTLEFDGSVAILSYNRPDKHNAFNNAADAKLWELLAEIKDNENLRAVVWRGNGKSFSSGRDLTEMGGRPEGISDLEFIENGHKNTKLFFEIEIPIIVAIKGWAMGGSFQRALLCDMRIAGESAKMRLPEVTHGVLPDTGGTARLFQIAGHGIAADMVYTGRVMDAEEALRHGVVSRVVADDQLDDTVLEVAHQISKSSAFAVKMFKRNLHNIANPEVQRSLTDEALTQAMVFQSEDYQEGKLARQQGRDPDYKCR